MSDVIHLMAKHPVTKRFGTWATPLEQVATACRSHWSTRPRRTYGVERVTCEACKLFAIAHGLKGLWWKKAA